MKTLAEVRKQGKRIVEQMIGVGQKMIGEDRAFIDIFEVLAQRAYVAGFRDGEASK